MEARILCCSYRGPLQSSGLPAARLRQILFPEPKACRLKPVYCTVKFTVVVCVVEPDCAATVTVYVPAGVPVGVGLGVGGGPMLPPPHATNNATRTSARASNNPRLCRRTPPMMTTPAIKKKTAYSGSPRHGDVGRPKATPRGVVVMVKVVVTGDEPGVTGFCENKHSAPVGFDGDHKVQANCTRPVNPPAVGVTVMDHVADCPAVTVLAGLEEGGGREKSGPTIWTVTAVEALPAKVASPPYTAVMECEPTDRSDLFKVV